MATQPGAGKGRRTDSNRERFYYALRGALKGDDKLARRLHQPLWKTVMDFSKAADPYQTVYETGAAHAAKAHAIGTAARQLLKLLPRFDPVVREAVALGFLSEAPPRESLPSSLGDALERAYWPAAVDVRGLLAKLAHDAESWASQAKRRAKRPVGRKLDFDRVMLSEWVGLQLAHVGVPFKIPKLGLFTRVLSVVQQSVGYTKRTPEDTYRDAKRALMIVEEHLARLQHRAATQSTKK
jgi:hypothetical protein